MGNRNNKTTENKPIGNGFTNQNKSYGKTLFSRQPWPGGAPKSEEANRHADIHSSSDPQSLDTSELSRDADGIKVSNVKNTTNQDNAQQLQLLPSVEANLRIEQIAVNVVCKARILIGLCENLKTWLELGDPIYKECKKGAYRYYWQDWWKVRREIEDYPDIEQRLYERNPKIKEVFFQLKKLDYYLEFNVPLYGKFDPDTIEFLCDNPRKAIELTLITTKYVTSLLDKISPPHTPTMTSDDNAETENSSNSAIEDGSVNVKIDDNSNISDCVAPIEESLPLDHNSLKPNNPTMTSDDNAEVENSSNSAIEDGPVNVKIDDNSKTEESMSRTCILDKLHKQTERRMEIISALADSDGEMKKKTIEDKIKEKTDHNQKGDRTYKNDLKELVNIKLVSRGLGTKGYYFVDSEVRDALKQYFNIRRKKVK